MKRRGFLKGLLLLAAAPVAAKSLIKDDEPVVMGIDPAKQGAEHTSIVWGIETEGGYFYSDELSEKLREMAQPLIKFREFKNFGLSPHQIRQKRQDAYNALCSKRLDNVKLVKNPVS